MNPPESPVRVGLLGCGMVAHEYVATINASPIAQVGACADINENVAAGFARKHRISRVLDVGRLLDPDVVDIVVVLTPPETHVELTHAALSSGIPAVYVEKPLAFSSADAAELLAAAERTDTLLGCAPDTILGAPIQTAKKTIDDGSIGQPVAATASYLSSGPERWHPAPEIFYSAGMGPLADMGPYYLATLTYLLGPLSNIHGALATTRPHRTIYSGPRAGKKFEAKAATHVLALLETTAGVPVNLVASFDAPGTRASHIEIHGTDATLLLPDPNFAVGEVLLRPRNTFQWLTVPAAQPRLRPVGRGMGVLELVERLVYGIPHLCNGALGFQTATSIESIRIEAGRRTSSPASLGYTPSEPPPRHDRPFAPGSHQVATEAAAGREADFPTSTERAT